MITIETLETSSLGDRSYVVADGEVAVVVDPQRDIDRVLDLVEERGWQVTHVLETHVHNDYVSGGLELARLRSSSTRPSTRTSTPTCLQGAPTETSRRAGAHAPSHVRGRAVVK